MPTQVILLERVEKLGGMGDVVAVKPGYARNFLLPQAKALRATKENIAYYEAQKSHLQKANAEKKGEAQKIADKIDGIKVVIIRQASEGGQLFGSVSSRDIAEELSAQSKQTITRGQVYLNASIKAIGLSTVDVILHPEVKVKIALNIARSTEEAVIQAKTGKAVIADSRGEKSSRTSAPAVDAKAEMLEEGAIANEQLQADEEAEKAAKKASKKSKKKDEGEDDAAVAE